MAEAACAKVACGACGAGRWCDSYLKTQESALGNPGLQMNCTWKPGARGSHRAAEPNEIACTGPRFNRHLGVFELRQIVCNNPPDTAFASIVNGLVPERRWCPRTGLRVRSGVISWNAQARYS